MLKKALATAIAVTLFACSSDDGGGDKKSPSSSSTGGNSSSSGENTPSFNVLYNFETESDNAIGYAFGSATLGNDCVIDEDGECVLDADGEPYLNWTPGGIFTLKDFSFNGGTQSNSGGGLILKNLNIKNYASIKFDARSTAEGNHSFRIKADKDGKGLAIRYLFELDGTRNFETITVEIDKNNFTKDYNDAGISDAELADYVLENATEVEFLIPIGRFSPNTSATKHTLEIDNFAVLRK